MPPNPASRSNSSLQESVAELTLKVAVLANELLTVKQRQDEDRANAERRFVTMDKFVPVRMVVYGVTGIAGSALLTALVTFFLRKP